MGSATDAALSRKNASRPVSRVLCRRIAPPRWPFIWDARCRAPQATNPDGDAETHSAASRSPRAVPSLFGFAPGGVYLAAPVASRAVRSYRTLSPLLHRKPNPEAERPQAAPEARWAQDAAVCFLWHCPWGCPRRTLSGAVFPWSPDFPPFTHSRPFGP